ncbi:MAG TPA: hypothetical protein VF026_13040 [Ktedonobacteraceae bacterium]
MGLQDGLQLDGSYLVALVLDQLLDAVNDPKPALLIDDSNVAGVQPAVRVNGLRGSLKIVEVAAHHGRGPHEKFSTLTGGDILTRDGVNNAGLHIRQGRPDGLRVIPPTVGSKVGAAAQLCHAEPLLDPAAESPGARLGQFSSDRGGTRGDDAQAGEVVAVYHRLFGQRQHNGGNQLGPRDAVRLHHAQKGFQVEARQDHQRRPCAQAEVHRDLHPEDVEQRENCHDDIIGLHLVGNDHLAQVGHELAMRQHNPLGEPARPAREGQEHEVVRGEVNWGVNLRGLRQGGERGRAVGLPEDEALTDARLGGGLPPLLLKEFRGGHQKARTGVRELGRDVMAGCSGVHGRDDGARRGGGKVSDHKLWTIGSAEREDVSFGHAMGLQSCGDAPDCQSQVAVAEDAAGERVDHGGGVAPLLGLHQDERW